MKQEGWGLEGDAWEESFFGENVEILGDGLQGANHGVQVGIDGGGSITCGLVGWSSIWWTGAPAAGAADGGDLGVFFGNIFKHSGWWSTNFAVNKRFFEWRIGWGSRIGASHSCKSSGERARDRWG